MTPFYSDDHLTLYGGDCRAVLAELPAESVHCVVTSPPYWGLRDYGVGGQLGLEATPEAFVANMVAVFREVRRVLRKDGTLWLNLGASGGSVFDNGRTDGRTSYEADKPRGRMAQPRIPGLKPKDLVGIPWRVAFALQADGWYLRSDIIWAKPNPMPESVTDRPTKAHEYLFLLTKSPRYYYDAEAVREKSRWVAEDGTPLDSWGRPIAAKKYGRALPDSRDGEGGVPTTLGANVTDGQRNLRTVWTIATEPYPGAHFATFPRKLVEPCVKAGTSERGVCPECGAPWVREFTRDLIVHHEQKRKHDPTGMNAGSAIPTTVGSYDVTTTGWSPSCRHGGDPVPATVLDPFAGSGTTLLVAQALGRRGVGIDLSPDYLKQALERNRQAPLGLVG